MGSLRKIFHRLVRAGILELAILRYLRVSFVTREAKHEEQRVTAASSRTGVQTLNPAGLREELGKPDADTLFILGSGASVNSLTESHFDTIADQISVGVNAWVLHSFVPDFYSYEPVSERHYDQFRTLTFMSRADILDRKPHIVFLKPRNAVEEEQLCMIPRDLAPLTHLYGRFQPFTRRLSNLAGDLDTTLKRLTPASPVVPDSGASVVRLVSLGLLMRFKKIVLVGVDLFGSNYFWEDDPSHLTRNGVTSWEGGQKPGLHETMSPQNRAFVALDMFGALGSVSRQRGIQLLVASTQSLLTTRLDGYSFPDGQRKH